MNRWEVILGIAVIITFNVACSSDQITLEEANTEEYLSLAPESYEGRDKRIRSGGEAALSSLFAKSFEFGNVKLAEYYLNLGADFVTSELDFEDFIRELSAQPISTEHFSLLEALFSRYPEALFWTIKSYRGGSEQAAIDFLAEELNSSEFEKLLKYCTDINQPLDDKGKTLLFSIAVATRYLPDKKEKLDAIMAMGADLSIITADKRNILHFFKWWPPEEDYSDMLNKIKNLDIDFNQQDIYGATPLLYAVHPFGLVTNSPAYVRYLLDNGASKEVANNEGWYPVDYVYAFERGFVNATEEEIKVRKKLMKELISLLDFR